jgi:hypothetical protein
MSIVHQNALEIAAAQAVLEDSPTEVVMDDIVDSTTAIQQAADQVGEISRNVEEMSNVASSVENYTTRFLEQVSAESWTPRLAHQYQVGMDAILRTCGVSVPAGVYAASFEAAGVTQTNEENRKETKGKSEGVIKRLWTSFLEMITRLWDGIQNFIAFLGASTGKLNKLADNIKARVTKARGERLTTTSHSMHPGPWSVYLTEGIGGRGVKIYSDPVKAIHAMTAKSIGFTEEWYKNYLDSVKAMAGANFASLADMDDSSFDDEVKRLLNPKLASFNGDWPCGHSVSVDRDGSHPDKFILEVKSGKYDLTEVPLLTFDQMESVAHEIKETAKYITHEVSRFQSGKAEINTMKKMMESAIKNGEKPINSKVVSLAGSLMDGMMEGPRKILPLLGTCCVNAAKHVTESLTMYSAAK